MLYFEKNARNQLTYSTGPQDMQGSKQKRLNLDSQRSNLAISFKVLYDHNGLLWSPTSEKPFSFILAQ